MNTIIHFIINNWAIETPLLWAIINEILANNSKIASNSLVQALINLFKKN